jgi:type IV pilus assembly protein PilA
MPRNGERGFTLIEILVVLLIIIVLASIALPLFINQRMKAQDVEAKATARVVVGALEVYYHDHDTYTGVDRPALERIEPSLAEARAITVSGSDEGYTLTVASASGTDGGGPFEIEHTLTSTTRTCVGAGRGGCPDTGTW